MSVPVLTGFMTSNLDHQADVLGVYGHLMTEGQEEAYVDSILGLHDLVRFNASRQGAVGSPRGVSPNEHGHHFDQFVSSSVNAGPRRLTGAYFDSIQVVIKGAPGYVEGEVGTDAPFGRRLELGFVGVDSIGRNYNQPPYPHFGPAWDIIVSKIFFEAIEVGIEVLHSTAPIRY